MGVVQKDRPGVEALVLLQVAVAPGADPADGLLAPLFDDPHHLRGQFLDLGAGEEPFDFEVPLLAVGLDLLGTQHR